MKQSELKRSRFTEEAVALKNGCLHVSVHGRQRVTHTSEVALAAGVN